MSVLLTTWAWLLMAVVGSMYSTFLARAAWGDLRAVPAGARVARLVARATFLRDVTRLVVQGLMAIAGFVALLNIPAPGPTTSSTVTRLVFRAIFILIGALVMASSVVDYRAREATLSLIRASEREEG